MAYKVTMGDYSLRELQFSVAIIVHRRPRKFILLS
jgi:hypothetical protein